MRIECVGTSGDRGFLRYHLARWSVCGVCWCECERYGPVQFGSVLRIGRVHLSSSLISTASSMQTYIIDKFPCDRVQYNGAAVKCTSGVQYPRAIHGPRAQKRHNATHKVDRRSADHAIRPKHHEDCPPCSRLPPQSSPLSQRVGVRAIVSQPAMRRFRASSMAQCRRTPFRGHVADGSPDEFVGEPLI